MLSKKLAKEARLNFRQVILPEMREKARQMVATGLAALAADVVLKGHISDSVRITASKFPGHHQRFFELVRRHVPVDIKVERESHSTVICFAVGKLYGSDVGQKEYGYPTWNISSSYRHHCHQKVRHNLEFLKKRKKWSLKIEAFTILLEFFGCAKSRDTPKLWNAREDHFIQRPGVAGLEASLLEMLLLWSQKHPESIIKLHRQEEHVAFYRDMPIPDSRVQCNDPGKIEAECQALLAGLL